MGIITIVPFPRSLLLTIFNYFRKVLLRLLGSLLTRQEQHICKEERIEVQQINRKIKQKGGHNICEQAVGEAAGGTGKEPLHH